MKKRPKPPRNSQAGFTLTELAVVLVIVAILLGGMLLPMVMQDNLRRTQESETRLNEAREALIGFAVANDRLPCPATAASNGQESFQTGGSAADGTCATFYGGFVPAATLGLGPVNASGQLIDGWNRPVRYAVSDKKAGTIERPFTRTDGIRNATMSAIAGVTPQLSVCATATGITNVDCGTATVLTDKTPVVIFSQGRPDADEGTGADAQANRNGDTVFVSHPPAPEGTTNGEFDDLLTWLSPNILYSRMIAAGRLP